MADPGFPTGGRRPIGGCVDPLGVLDPQCEHFLAKMYAKMKELGPVGGSVCPARPLDPPMPRICIALAKVYPEVYSHVGCLWPGTPV